MKLKRQIQVEFKGYGGILNTLRIVASKFLTHDIGKKLYINI